MDRRNFFGMTGAALAGGLAGSMAEQAAEAKPQPQQQRGMPAEVDVLVAGGGPAGIGAAIAAARAGAKTLLLERHAFFGGVASYCLGMTINQMRPNRRARGAVHELLIERVLSYGKEAGYFDDHALVCNVEYFKVAVMDVLDAVGCPYLLHTRAIDAIVEDGRAAGVVVSTKEGPAAIRAQCVVDATGDADVAFFAGAETLKGREGDGFLSPMTLCFNIINVDVPVAQEFMRGGGIARLLKDGREKYPLLPDSMGLQRIPLQNAFNINHAGTKRRGVLDGTVLADLTEAERYSRRQILQIVQALREFGGPAFQNAQLGAAGPQIGVRETRRVKGLYVLTEDDAKSGSRFDDAVAWRSGFLDVGFVRYEKMQVHDVPYRALVPEKIDGLLVAGRCISATHVGAASGKSMGNCMATGHAAGLAAALSVKKAIAPRRLEVAELRTALAADGVDLARKKS
jgi:hypothetical protein